MHDVTKKDGFTYNKSLAPRMYKHYRYIAIDPRGSGFRVGNHKNNHKMEESFVKKHEINQFEYFHHCFPQKTFIRIVFVIPYPEPHPGGSIRNAFPEYT